MTDLDPCYCTRCRKAITREMSNRQAVCNECFAAEKLVTANQPSRGTRTVIILIAAIVCVVVAVYLSTGRSHPNRQSAALFEGLSIKSYKLDTTSPETRKSAWFPIPSHSVTGIVANTTNTMYSSVTVSVDFYQNNVLIASGQSRAPVVPHSECSFIVSATLPEGVQIDRVNATILDAVEGPISAGAL